VIARLLGRLNRLQRQRGFKIAASIAVIILIVGVFIAASIAANAPETPVRLLEFRTRQTAHATDPLAPRVSMASAAVNSVLTQLSSPDGVLAVGIGFVAFGVVSLAVIWLGLALTYLAVLTIAMVVAWPLASIDATAGLGRLILGIVPLALAFLTLLELMRVALSASNPVAAIARNVLNEAVRMKISVVFIVMLLLLLAVVPGALNEDQPLRYRVQQWLQYGIGFSYAVMALLTAFLSVGTVVFEQRDRIVWQTATKPVRAWQYVCGKWVGVMCLNLVLLVVSACGVYLFTEYLRHKPANGESAYMVDLRGNSTRGDLYSASLDRRLLETQVLVARIGSKPQPFALTEFNLQFRVDEQLKQITDPTPEDRRRLEQEIRADWDAMITEFVDAAIADRSELGMEERRTVSPRLRARIEKEIIDRLELEARSIDPGSQQSLLFDATSALKHWHRFRDRAAAQFDAEVDARLATAEWRDRPRDEVINALVEEKLAAGTLPTVPELTLRYRLQAGSNDPSKIYRVYFLINGAAFPDRGDGQPAPTEVTLDTAASSTFPAGYLGESPRLVLTIASDPSNDRTITIPPDGLEILHTVGGYEINFVRVVATLWIKLGFIAAVGIAAATFLSFPVSSLMTLGVLFMAESAVFLSESLEWFATKDRDGSIKIMSVVAKAISWPIAKAFHMFADLQPTAALVDGRLLAWSTLAAATGIIGLWTIIALSIGIAIYRRRELALYSGQ
jgi:hypothetical protein